MFAKDVWYMAAWSDEISGKPLGRRLLNEPVVLFRSLAGEVSALEDRCCHRGLPLVHGEVVGEGLRCGYHGLTFDCSGRCVRIPGQETIPAKARVRAYPVQERDGMVWIWMGDPSLANPEDIVAHPWHGDPRWVWRKDCYRIAANHLLIYDNLLDLTHLGYVHRVTIGGDPDIHSFAETEVRPTDKGVRMVRWLRDTRPPPTFTALATFKGNIDRWQEIDFVPGLVHIASYGVDHGAVLDESQYEGRVQLRGTNAMTPETEHSTHYFWSIACNFKIDQPEIVQELTRQIVHTFKEDQLIVEAQYARLRDDPQRPLLDIHSDVAGLRARRILARLSGSGQARGA